MFRQKKVRYVIMLLIAILSFTACGNKENESVPEKTTQEDITKVVEPVEEEKEEEKEKETVKEEEPIKEEKEEETIKEEEPIGPISVLTGLPISEEAYNRRPVGVMISNIKSALPQYGISEAEIIYEAVVEGGICRQYAIFQDFATEKIGPVRSARHYYLDFAFDHDALYVHYGQSPQAQKAFRDLKASNMNGILGSIDALMCYRDPNRRAPHSTFTSFEGLMAAWDYVNYRVEPKNENTKFAFDAEFENINASEPASSIILDFSNYHKPWFEYNEDEGVYYRYQFSEAQIDANNNEQLKFKNIIVQYTSYSAIPGDTEGRLNADLVSSGDGLYITEGKAYNITWSKASHHEPTKYLFTDGSPLIMNPGKTFVNIYPDTRINLMNME